MSDSEMGEFVANEPEVILSLDDLVPTEHTLDPLVATVSSNDSSLLIDNSYNVRATTQDKQDVFGNVDPKTTFEDIATISDCKAIESLPNHDLVPIVSIKTAGTNIQSSTETMQAASLDTKTSLEESTSNDENIKESTTKEYTDQDMELKNELGESTINDKDIKESTAKEYTDQDIELKNEQRETSIPSEEKQPNIENKSVEEKPENGSEPELDEATAAAVNTIAIDPETKARYDEAVRFYLSGDCSVRYVVDRFHFNYSKFRLYLELKCPGYRRSKRGRPPKPKGTHKFQVYDSQYIRKAGRPSAGLNLHKPSPIMELVAATDKHSEQSKEIQGNRVSSGRISQPVIKWAPPIVPVISKRKLAPKIFGEPMPEFELLRPIRNKEEQQLLRFMERQEDGSVYCKICQYAIASNTRSKLLRHCTSATHRTALMHGSNNIHATLYNVESNFPILRELKKNPIQHYIISFERAAELVRILPNTPPRQLVNMILVNHQYMKKRAILCIFLRRYYLKRYIISRLLTVEDIQADPELKAIYEEGVNTYINDPDITMEQVASNLGFHQSVFRTYMSETRPTFAVEKREHARPTEDPLEAIKRDPEMKTKYDKAVAAYVRLEVSSMSKAASDAGVKLPLFKLYLHKECPDHQEKRAAAITANITLPNKDFLHRYRERLKNMMNMDSVKYMRKQNDGSSYCDLCMCRIRGQKAADLLDHYDSVRHQNSLRSLGETDNLRHEYNNDPLPPPPTPPLDPTEQHVILLQAPKDPSAADNSTWAAQSQASSSRGSKEMSPRPSTSSAAHVGGFMIKPDPGTPPPTQPVLSPYVQEPPMVAPAPRLMPKPTPPPQSLIQQQTPRLRVRQPPPQVVAPPPPPPPDPEAQQVCLRWNSFHNNMQTMFPSLLSREKFVDVTLACDGRSIKCHKVVLSSCSSYLERLLTDNPCKHPIILMPRDMRYWQVRALVDFMYRGEVNVEHEQLASLLSAAEFLQVKGLAGPSSSTDTPMSEDIEPEPPMSPRPKRKRVASPSPSPAPQPHSQQPPPPPPPLQQQHTRQQQQHHVQRTSSPTLPNSPAVSITRLRHSASSASAASSSQHSPSAVATASTSRDPSIRAQSPGIEITPVVSFEEIKVEPIDISDSNDESMDPSMQHCSVDYDMDNGDVDKDYQDDDDLDGDSGDGDNTMAEDDTGGGDMDVPGSSHGDDGAGSDVTAAANGPAVTGGATVATPSFSGNGLDIDDAAYSASELGLRTEPNEDPPDAIAGPSTEDA